MKKISLLSFILIAFFSILNDEATAQTTDVAIDILPSRKGEFYAYWGWNGAAYTRSDISFEGDNYDFTLYNVRAQDRQSKFSFAKYFGPTSLTIPQYNARIGYFITHNWNISLGVDHMKYVVEQNQNSSISGFIENSGTPYDGTYQNDNIVIEEGLLELEHTDGLNYANIGLRREASFFQFKNLSLHSILGIEAGVLIPKTNTVLLNNERYDQFHFSGFGLNVVTGISFNFYNRFFIQSELKGGYINLPWVRTTQSSSDSASQSFFFTQLKMVLGYRFRL